MSFEEKVVVVTGSSSGIGASTAIEFAKQGAYVVLVGRNEEKLKNARGQCEKYGKKALVVRADVSNDTDCKRIIDETIQKFAKIDVLVNNAGFLENIDIANEHFMEVYDRIINVNLRGVVFITHLVVPHLIKSKGNIINISSVAGSSTLGTPEFLPYCVSKAGINHFTRCAAMRLASFGIRVNAVSPGPVKTDILDHGSTGSHTWEQIAEMTALKRVSEPEEIADLILFLASEKARGITGSNFLTDNGTLIAK